MTTTGARRTLYDWFAASVAAYPNHPALQVGDQLLSYAELSAHAERIARALVSRCVGKVPRRVGLLASRTVAAYAGYLAVQRLGATVVPLGTAFPVARNAAVVGASGPDLVFTDGGCEPGELPAQVWRHDADDLSHLGEGLVPTRRAGPDDIAYILFTSGSTGTPKGVPVRHRNVCAYLEHVVPRHEAGPGARLSQTFDLTFDPSVFDMFVAWGSGATLVVPTRDELLAPVRFVNRRGITHWNSVPSVITIAERLRALKPDSMPTLRRSVFCGEPLTLRQARSWQRAASGGALENAYGPTELTVTCVAYRLPADVTAWPDPVNGTVPIGEPHPGLDVLMRDGELCVRGPQRFGGYLDPADNAGRFLAPDGTPDDPVDRPTDKHWYRTGDRVERWGPSGVLVHLGRLDQQVQVHGYRVELGEVEGVLRARPGVADAVALAPETRAGTRLVAAVSGDGTRTVEPGELLASLRERLPAYMVPDEVTVLDALPLNANGKIDRAAVASALGGPGNS